MTGIVRPARGGLNAQNKVTKLPSSTAARRQGQNHQQQLLTAAVLEQQQHQSNQATAAGIHHSLGAPGDDTDHIQLHSQLQNQHQHQHHLAIHHDPLTGAGLDDPNSHAHAHPHDLHEDHHHHSMVDLDLPDTDDKTEPDHTSLHDAVVSKVPADVDAQIPQNMDLSGADGSLLDGNSSLLDDGGAAYDSPPADSPPDHQSVDAASVAHHHHHALNFNAPMRSTGDMARASGYDDYKIESALAKRLFKEPGLRHAQQRRPEQMLNLQRRSNVEALFAHIAGVEAMSPCKNCRKGHGPWHSCVIVEGQMCGACANCWFNASGARCSFHEARTSQGNALPTPQQHPGGNHSMQTPSAPSPHDAYGVGSPLNLAPQSHNGLPSGINFNSSAMNTTNMNHNSGATQDAAARLTLERSLQELRGADRKQRQLLKIELTAKQLALQIVEYEDMLAHDARQHQLDAGATGEAADGA